MPHINKVSSLQKLLKRLKENDLSLVKQGMLYYYYYYYLSDYYLVSKKYSNLIIKDLASAKQDTLYYFYYYYYWFDYYLVSQKHLNTITKKSYKSRDKSILERRKQ